jgi:hypothetical protein
VTDDQLPDLVVGLIKVRDAHGRSADEGAETVPYVAELTAIVHNQGNAVADETTTRFWVRGAEIDMELRAIYTPVVPPGEEIEVTALWDIRGRAGRGRPARTPSAVTVTGAIQPRSEEAAPRPGSKTTVGCPSRCNAGAAGAHPHQSAGPAWDRPSHLATRARSHSRRLPRQSPTRPIPGTAATVRFGCAAAGAD